MEEIDQIVDEKSRPLFFGVKLTDRLRDIMRLTGPGPLREFCLELFDRRPEMTRYLHISFLAALLSRPAAEVFEKYSPYLLTEEPAGDAERKTTLNTVLLRALDDVWWHHHEKQYVVSGGQTTAQPYTYSRWLFQLGGSPRGLLGRALAKDPKANHLYTVWQLMYDAWQALGAEETIPLLEEVLAEGAFQKQAAPHIQKAIPWTIQQLRAGEDFPSNLDWNKL